MTEGNAWKTYLENAHRTEELQAAVIKGAKAGESPCRLLLQCAQAISLMTDNPTFDEQIERSVRAVYGEALRNPDALEIDLEQTRDRLARITEAEAKAQSADLKEELQHAIRAHRSRIAYLEEQLKDATEPASADQGGEKHADL